MKKVKKLISLALAMCVAFTGAFSLAAIDVHAAVATPAKVTGLSVKATGPNTVKITYKKAKNATGYCIYRGGKRIKSTTALSYTDSKLKPSTKYTYKVRAYKAYKQKQYYNSKTKKWQVKKPKKSQWKGKKTRSVTKYKYGKYTSNVTVTTKADLKVTAPVISVVAEGMNATITWKPVKNADEYLVLRNGDVVAHVKGTSYVDTPYEQRGYTYEVEAVNKYSREISNYVTVHLWDIDYPDESYDWPAPEEAQKEAFAVTNEILVSYGQNSLEWDDRVAAVAQRKAEYMAKTGILDFRIPELGGNAWDMLEADGMEYEKDLYYVGEGFARNIKEFDSTLLETISETAPKYYESEDWDLISGNYSHIGIGYYKGYISLVFIKADGNY